MNNKINQKKIKRTKEQQQTLQIRSKPVAGASRLPLQSIEALHCSLWGVRTEADVQINANLNIFNSI